MAYNFLLVDDSSIVRKALKKALGLTQLNISELHEAADGQQALEILNDQWIDLVFLDINMPVMNGIEFMEAVSKSNELSDTKVIVVSTEGSEARRKQLKDLGVLGQLRKPFTPESLIEKVEEILHGGANRE